MNDGTVDIKKGSVNFWIKEGKIQFNDNKTIPLFQKNFPDGNSISITKDSNNKLKFSHAYIGKGCTEVEYDVSLLSSKEKHMVTATWSLEKKEILLYVDGKEVARSKIIY